MIQVKCVWIKRRRGEGVAGIRDAVNSLLYRPLRMGRFRFEQVGGSRSAGLLPILFAGEHAVWRGRWGAAAGSILDAWRELAVLPSSRTQSSELPRQ